MSPSTEDEQFVPLICSPHDLEKLAIQVSKDLAVGGPFQSPTYILLPSHLGYWPKTAIIAAISTSSGYILTACSLRLSWPSVHLPSQSGY
jgi:hypothetical protein